MTKKHWPTIQFDASMTEDDTYWHPTNRETMTAMRQRIAEFMHDLCKYEEDNIVVVSHGVWIEACLHLLAPAILEGGKKRVYNCNMFFAECISDADTGQFMRLDNVNQI